MLGSFKPKVRSGVKREVRELCKQLRFLRDQLEDAYEDERMAPAWDAGPWYRIQDLRPRHKQTQERLERLQRQYDLPLWCPQHGPWYTRREIERARSGERRARQWSAWVSDRRWPEPKRPHGRK